MLEHECSLHTELVHKNTQLDDCGRSSTMSMLLQHGYIHAQ